MSPIDPAALQELYAQDSRDALVCLLEIPNPDGPDTPPWPFRLTDNTEDVVSNGDTYTSSAFVFEPPEQTEGTSPVSRISIPAAPVDLARQLVTVTSKPTLSVKLVMLSDPDTTVREFLDIGVVRFEGGTMGLTVSLQYDRLVDIPYPPTRFGFNNYPGGFGA